MEKKAKIWERKFFIPYYENLKVKNFGTRYSLLNDALFKNIFLKKEPFLKFLKKVADPRLRAGQTKLTYCNVFLAPGRLEARKTSTPQKNVTALLILSKQWMKTINGNIAKKTKHKNITLTVDPTRIIVAK
ncbi:hypothetical protein KKA23_01305 [Patescibacteria group bacterium]|nr:hypothetical protein [Patescibacteria group bacterium]